MSRVAAEVRIFPLLTLDGGRSAFVDNTTATLRRSGFDVRIENVPYAFQHGGNQMLRVSHP
jgi:hypothetical protein